MATRQFASDHVLEVEGRTARRRSASSNAIIAAGSSAVALPFLPDDPRIIDCTGALALEDVPGRLLVIGGGIIGLEMATVYDALGSEVTVVEAARRAHARGRPRPRPAAAASASRSATRRST